MKQESKIKESIILLFFAIYFAALLWLTLISRVGNSSSSVLSPFWSYKEIIGGNIRVLFLVIANVVLFVPFGFFLIEFLNASWKKVLLIGIIFSSLIECIQLIARLGEFEIDDIINNTIGTLLGGLVFTLFEKIRILKKSQITVVKLLALSILVITFCFVPFGFKYLYKLYMQNCASRYNSTDGNSNLLVLNGKWGFVGDSNVFVYYSLNGEVHITGSSDIRAWKQIGEVELEPGEYYVSGFSGVESQSFTIEFEVYDAEEQKYWDVTSELGAVSEDYFELLEKTTIKVYVGVYPGCEGTVIATPVIYEMR